jgi:hypothetical protein
MPSSVVRCRPPLDPGVLHNKDQIESQLVQWIFSAVAQLVLIYHIPHLSCAGSGCLLPGTDAEPAQSAREVAGSIPHWAGGAQTCEQSDSIQYCAGHKLQRLS